MPMRASGGGEYLSRALEMTSTKIAAANHSRLGRKISRGVGSFVAFAVILACIGSSVYNFRRNNNLVRDRLLTLSATTEAISASMLANNQNGPLRALLGSFTSERDVVSVIALDRDGKRAAQYQRELDTVEKLDAASVATTASQTGAPGPASFAWSADYLDVVMAITDPRDRNVRLGTLALRWDLQPWTSASWKESASVGGIGIAIMLVLLMSLRALLARATAPLSRLTDSVEAMMSGARDVAIPALEQADEIGTLARTMQSFRQAIIEREAMEAERNAEADGKVRQLAQRNALVEHLRQETGASIGALNDGSKRLNDSADMLGDLASNAVRRVVAASEAVQTASSNIIGVAQSAEEMARSIAEIDQQTSNMKMVSARAADRVRDSEAAMVDLADRARQIDAIVALIRAIAEQTNLLALNATIEAARAGEAGRGFAVVAQEVKNLATQTAQATENITTQVGAVQTASDEAVAAIRVIAQSMVDLDISASGIATAMTQQASTTSEIARNVGNAAQAATIASNEVGELESAAAATDNSAISVRDAADAVAREAQNMRVAITRFLDDVTSSDRVEAAAAKTSADRSIIERSAA